MNLYLDASALVKRYVAEPGSGDVRRAMETAEGWFVCRVGFVEVVRAVALTAGQSAADRMRDEWPAFGVIEVDDALAEHAATLAVRHELRTLDALHLASALVLPADELVVATWDRRLHTAARAEGIEMLPGSLAG